MSLRSRKSGFLVYGALALLLGCNGGDAGGGPGALVGGDDDTGDDTSTGGGTGSPGSGGSGTMDLGEGTPLTAGASNACAAKDAASALTPLYLVFMYDTSGSMGDQTWTDATGKVTEVLNRALRWEPMKAGMIAFFNDPASTNVFASLDYFPAVGDFAHTCMVSNYSAPSVPLTALNAPDALVSSLNRKEPEGGTPTLPALRGAVEYALTLKRENDSAHVAVVLVTDGEPAVIPTGAIDPDPNCPAGDSQQNTVEGVAAIARAAYSGNPSIPVHVIGVGESMDSLEQIANAGGNPLTVITATDAEATTAQLRETLQAIQVAQFSCYMDIPDPPAGEVFNKELVNVSFTHSNGTADPFVKSVGCVGGIGWQYDNTENPTKIELCQETCNSIQNDPTGQLKTAFGCRTIVR